MKAAVKFLTLLPLAAQADEADLWITEVLPSTGQIEVTNTGEAFTTTRALPFCHDFNYATNIPSGTDFAAGESRIYTVTFANPSASDLWLYRPGSFGNGANIISGLQWNTTVNIGRSNLASTVNLWNGGTESAPAPAANQSIQLTGPNPFSAENWTVGEPNLGSFGITEELAPVALSLSRSADQLTLTWTGGAPPYQVQVSDDLMGFDPIGGFTDELSVTLPFEGDRRFYQVISMAMLPQTARYRVTYASLWSGLTFVNVPSAPTLGDLIGTTHNDQISFWAPDENASNGVTSLADTGSSTLLTSEVGIAIANNLANQFIAGPGIDQELDTSSFEITVDRDFPLLSLVSRLNDSPDWFTGVQNLNLIGEDQDFRDRIEIMLMPWDAGIDSGSSFGTENEPTAPRATVSNLTNSPAFRPSLFLGVQSEPIPVAGLIIERIVE